MTLREFVEGHFGPLKENDSIALTVGKRCKGFRGDRYNLEQNGDLTHGETKWEEDKSWSVTAVEIFVWRDRGDGSGATGQTLSIKTNWYVEVKYDQDPKVFEFLKAWIEHEDEGTIDLDASLDTRPEV